MAIRAASVLVALCMTGLAARPAGQGYPSSRATRPDTPIDGIVTSSDGLPLTAVETIVTAPPASFVHVREKTTVC